MTSKHVAHPRSGAAPAAGGTADAYDVLAARDPALAALMTGHGRPDPFSWGVLEDAAGDDPFAEMALHIVSQQISTTAALAIFRRLGEATGAGLAPEALLATAPERLRAAGLSGAKARSLHDLAERVLDGRLDFDRLGRADDAAAQEELELVHGIGPWSAQMFLLHRLRRPDVFPAADVGLQRAAASALGLAQRPTADELAARAEPWRPYRSYAAALLWAHGRDALAAERAGHVSASA
jgi:DNA-3-methyladenine glycosylase II